MIRLSVRAAALTAALVATAACADQTPLGTEPGADFELLRAPATAEHVGAIGADGTSNSASRVIGAEGGTLQVGAHRIDFPAGALSQPTEIRMTLDDTYVGVELEPHGIVFPAGREPTLTLGYADASAAGFGSLAVAYVENDAISELLPTRWDAKTQTVEARLNHFSLYATSGSRTQSGTSAGT
jgi:hypothetical protein